MDRYKILAIDDKKSVLDATRYCLSPLGIDVDMATTPEEGARIFRADPDSYALVIVDYDFEHPEKKSGADLIEQLRYFNPRVTIFVYSAVPDREALKKCWEAGANDFIDKGAETVTEELRTKVLAQCRKYRQTLEPFKYEKSETENSSLIASVGMVGVSAELTDVAEKITRYKNRPETVIIYGNTGTGKELVSRALATTGKPFLVVNCAAFKDAQLLESELFGYEKGAFTGADRMKQGILEIAKDGTVFFDEIHQLSLQGQAKLLRAFQEKKIRRLGGSFEYNIACRFIVASKPNLKNLVTEKLFLEDFYYRINKLSISIPDLKDRPNDIEPLISHFVDEFNRQENTDKALRVSVVKKLKTYSWPGNVRELENTLIQLLMNSPSKYVELEHLEPKFFDAAEGPLTLMELEEKHLQEKRDLIASTITKHRFKAEAARELGLAPSTLTTLEKNLNIYQPTKGRISL